MQINLYTGCIGTRLETKSEESASAMAGVGRVERTVGVVDVGVEVRLGGTDAGHHVAHADLAAADLLSKTAGLERRRQRLAELLGAVDRRQPEAQRRRVVVARAAAVALDERRRPERLETGAGRVKRLTGTVRPSARMLPVDTTPQGFTAYTISIARRSGISPQISGRGDSLAKFLPRF